MGRVLVAERIEGDGYAFKPAVADGYLECTVECFVNNRRYLPVFRFAYCRFFKKPSANAILDDPSPPPGDVARVSNLVGEYCADLSLIHI